jgi:diacylglycerol kinase (ATP)
MAKKRVLIIVNPVAGGSRGAEGLEDARKTLKAAGWNSVIRFTEAPGEATSLAYGGVLEHFDMILAAGGDGTIGQVVDGILSAPGEPLEKPQLGILPMGTGNVLAKDLGYPIPTPFRPMVYREAAQAILDGKVYLVDAGRANGKHFLSWCGVGFDAKVTQDVESNPEQKKRLGKAAFVVAGMVALNTYKGFKATINVDGKEITKSAVMILISNIQLYARFVRVAEEAKIDDGLLDVYVFEGKRGIAVAKHAVGILLKPSLKFKPPDVVYLKGKHIEITGKEPVPIHLDAEPYGLTPLYVDVVPKSLKLVIPTISERLLIAGKVRQQGVNV